MESLARRATSAGHHAAGPNHTVHESLPPHITGRGGNGLVAGGTAQLKTTCPDTEQPGAAHEATEAKLAVVRCQVPALRTWPRKRGGHNAQTTSSSRC